MKLQFTVNHRFVPALITGLVAISLPTATAGEKIAWAASKAPLQASFEKLKYSPELAFIPSYTGKQFVNTEAIRYTGLPTGQCYNVKYLMKEAPSIVHDWYLLSLRQCGWTIDETDSGSSAITARRADGLTCYIYTRPALQAGYACEMILRYAIRPV